MHEIKKHRDIPKVVGRTTVSSVHLTLFVSFQTVMQVVEHGQWNREKTMVHMAVTQVHPFAVNRWCNVFKLSYSKREPVDR